MDHPEGARETGDGRLGFDRRVRLEFRGTQLSSDGGLLVTCLMWRVSCGARFLVLSGGGDGVMRKSSRSFRLSGLMERRSLRWRIPEM